MRNKTHTSRTSKSNISFFSLNAVDPNWPFDSLRALDALFSGKPWNTNTHKLFFNKLWINQPITKMYGHNMSQSGHQTLLDVSFDIIQSALTICHMWNLPFHIWKSKFHTWIKYFHPWLAIFTCELNVLHAKKKIMLPVKWIFSQRVDFFTYKWSFHMWKLHFHMRITYLWLAFFPPHLN